ncbi:L,D-transpeptidase family protein, partial [Escherichia coli]|nr:L,D-transpeptidase family protein [Escherichia coli]
ERERWMPADRGRRHVLVNITDFHARIIAGGKVEFQTRSVVGANDKDRRTPEFSDVMEHMVVNPTWNVPRSIATKEYLPMLKEDPGAVSHLTLIDQRGQIVSREGMDFSEYDTTNFPFDMKQPPSNSNALGLVKFIFPNPHNIYLHDTPAKSLFGRESRAFSHGCIRLNDPFDFAYALLGRQTNDPEGYFHAVLRTGRETQVDLKEPLPVHIIYRTALTGPKGRVEFRRDI